MSSFLKMFGLGFTKVVSEPVNTNSPEKLALDKKIQDLSEHSSRKAADLYISWLTEDIFKEIVAYHPYKDKTWGSRRFGRLMNHSASFLDMERAYERFDSSEFHKYLEVVFWACLLVVIPIKKLYFNPGSENEMKEKFIIWMKTVGRLDDEQILNVINAVFAWDQESDGTVVHDVFYDAMRLEEMSFGVKLDLSIMRTHQGKNEVYRAYAAKSIANNRQPDWVMMMQEHFNSTDFCEPSIELINETSDGF